MFWSGTICTLLHTSKKTGKTEKKKGAKKKTDSDWNRCVTVCLKKEKNAMDVYDVLNATKTTFRTQQKEEKKWGWRKQNMYENTYTHTPSLSLILSSLNTQYDIKLKQIQSATLLLE